MGFIMEDFSVEKMANMHLMYALANFNHAAARRLCARQFPNRRLLNNKTHKTLKRINI